MASPPSSSSTTAKPWEDRRALFQRGREVHEPGTPIQPRRLSTNSTSDKMTRITSNESAGSPTSPASPGGVDRRRSSATSQGQAGMFGSLMGHKRGSEDYGTRRTSLHDQQMKSGAFGSWFGSTFKGVQGAGGEQAGGASGGGAAAAAATEARRGIME